MGNVFLFAALIALVFGAWIGHSGLRRWQGRHPQPSADPIAPVARLTDFRWRPQLQLLAGLLMMGWALRIFLLFTMDSFSPKPGTVRENPTTGRIENLQQSTPTASAIHPFAAEISTAGRY